jgi:hypothetical protein
MKRCMAGDRRATGDAVPLRWNRFEYIAEVSADCFK